jgi:hypothetical protein
MVDEGSDRRWLSAAACKNQIDRSDLSSPGWKHPLKRPVRQFAATTVIGEEGDSGASDRRAAEREDISADHPRYQPNAD